MKKMFELRDVKKVYELGSQSVEVLSNISFDIHEGDFVAIMGPSGAGKSTLLNLIGGVDRLSSGNIYYCGSKIDDLKEKQLTEWRAKNIGLVFQFYNLIPILTAFQNIELPLLIKSLNAKQRKARVETTLDLVGLSDRSHHRPGQLSGGQQQRVAIARAIVADPSVLVCDEPTGDLDGTSTHEIMSILKHLNTDFSKTIVLVTHDNEVAAYANRKFIMDKNGILTEEETNKLS